MEENQELEVVEQQEEIETEVKEETNTKDLLADIQKQKEELEQLKKEYFQKDVQFELAKNGLEQFASIVKVSNEDELKEVIQSLNQIVNDIKVSTGYVPKDNAKQNEYDVFASKGDTKGMIANKLSKLFG